MTTALDRTRLPDLMARERERFVETHPGSLAQYQRSRGSLLGGVPMGWMSMFDGGFPIVVAEAAGATLTDIDGNRYDDFFLGEGAALAGHAPPPVVDAIARQASRGLATMLPSDDAPWVAGELTRRFGLPVWHFALSATDANRFAIRLAREITGRQRLVLFGGYYHGTIDDAPGDWDSDGTFAGGDRLRAPGAGLTQVVGFNDLAALEHALASREVACVLLEPAILNVGIVLPEPGFHEAVRALTRRYGTLLLVDEALGLAAGPGGCTGAWGLAPDIVTAGKGLAGGIPAAAYGFTEDLAHAIEARKLVFCEGTGGTLAGNPLSLAALRATLGEVLTDDAFGRMIALAEYAAGRIDAITERHGQPWRTRRLGCRLQVAFSSEVPRTAAESQATMDDELSNLLRLWELNRGAILPPFAGNTLLMSAATTSAQVDRYAAILDEALTTLFSA